MPNIQTSPVVEQVLCIDVIAACNALFIAIRDNDRTAYAEAVENARRVGLDDEDVASIYEVASKRCGCPSFPA